MLQDGLQKVLDLLLEHHLLKAGNLIYQILICMHIILAQMVVLVILA
jgi:hypothetical protein